MYTCVRTNIYSDLEIGHKLERLRVSCEDGSETIKQIRFIKIEKKLREQRSLKLWENPTIRFSFFFLFVCINQNLH